MTPCIHRGPALFTLRNQLCGSRGSREPVYRCSIYTICTHRKYRHGQTEQVCLACDEYQPQQEANTNGKKQDDAPGSG